MFFGRKKELSKLNQLYRSDQFEFVVLYGRRRVGKTALINEFCKDKDTIYFTGTETSEKQNLENLSKCIFEQINVFESDASFVSFQAAFEQIFKIAKTKRIVFVMDEYPYAAHVSKGLSSVLQILIDKNEKTSKLMLILCGSSLSYMEKEVMSYKAPLYGRRTAQFKLQPFEFDEVCRCFPGYPPEDKALVYGLVGGTPHYLLQFKPERSIEENTKETFLNPMSFLYEEPENLLKQELREPAIYNAVLTAVANGATKITEIAGKAGIQTSACTPYLKSLLSLELIERETPYGEKGTKKSLYKIADNMFRFWYRFVPRYNSSIVRDGADLVYKRIEPYLSGYMGEIFEEISKQYLWKKLIQGNCAVEFTNIGRWWGSNPLTKSQEEIDILGEQDPETALFGECKWTNGPVDSGVLRALIVKSNIFHYSKKHYYLFAKSGFSDGCMELAASMGNVSLVTIQEIVNFMEN